MINDKMMRMMDEATSMEKLSFIKTDQKFTRKRFIIDMEGEWGLKAFEIRLNMIDIYGNYKGNVTLRRLCAPCGEEHDTTEHLVSRKKFRNNVISPLDLMNDSNKALWIQSMSVLK